MSFEQYKVSAIITTYKRDWDMVRCALESIVRQTIPVHEIIVVDDNNSTSHYSVEIRKMLDQYPQVKYIPMGMNSGVTVARNRGISEATGNIIGFLDDDDEWVLNKLEILLPLFDEGVSAGMVFGTGKVTNTSTGRSYYNWQWEKYNGAPTFQDMLENDYVGSTSSPLIRRAVFDEVGMFLPKGQPAANDYELWIRISKRFVIRGTREVVFLKYNDDTEHVSGSMDRLFQGFKNIYLTNKADYDKNPSAKLGIMWNIARVGVRGMNPKVIPWVFRWASVKQKVKKCEKTAAKS